MTRKPPIEDMTVPPTGTSGLPDLGTLEAEVTATRQTDTNHRPLAPSPRSARPTLTVLTGFDAGKVIVLAAEAVVGRGSESHLVLSDPGVSRAHARLVRVADEVVVYDLGSKNRTFVGEAVVGPSGRMLVNQDVIHFGPNVGVRFARMTDAEEKLARDLYESSMRDPLTRAYNRRYLANRLKAEVAYVARHGGSLSLLTFDFDHFKRLNDQHGHAAGDVVLREGAAVVTAALRSEDVLARVGGEEFVVVLRGIAQGPAMTCAERVRSAVERAQFSADGASVRATISVGVATSDEVVLDAGGTTLLKLADTRLYQAKAAGRNRLVGPAVVGERE